MQYDVASKVIIEVGKEAIIRRFLDIDPEEVLLMEQIQEETVSLKRSDFSA